MKLAAGLVADVRQARVEVGRPGDGTLSGRALWRVGQLVLTLVIVVTNLIGAGAVLVVAILVVPLPAVRHPGHVRFLNELAAGAYVALAVPCAALLGTRGLLRLRIWLMEERPATPDEQRVALRAPLRLFVVQLGFWLGAAILFGAFNSAYGAELALQVAATVAITGITTASCAYLLAERILRSVAARALAHGAPQRLVIPGVATRAVLAWALGTGLPVLGLVAVGARQLSGASRTTPSQLAVAMVALGGIGLAVGLLAVSLAARATAAPVDSVRRALARVQHGEFDVRVPVYDGTQIGQLQLGFNEMAAGLAERERIRAAFGTYVDPDVAEHVVREGTSFEGEEVEVTVMFVDVRGFTGFAERTPAREVVASLNRLFEMIVPIVHDHGGRVDKFVGDGLMAVFGAPRRQADHADQALAAALEIEDAVRGATGAGVALTVGIGLNSGPVIAGNVGAASRLEFSVIGDAVNVAARVEAATRQTGDTVLLTGQTRQLLRDGSIPLVERRDITLKGKTKTVRLYAPSRP